MKKIYLKGAEVSLKSFNLHFARSCSIRLRAAVQAALHAFLLIILSGMVLLMVLLSPFSAIDALAASKRETQYEYLDTTVKVLSFNKTVVTWKRRDADRYDIYKVSSDGSSAKKIASIPGNRTSITLKTKKNRHYDFEIIGRKYAGGSKTNGSGKAKKIWNGSISFYSGISPAHFDDYNYAEGFVSTKKIELQICSGEGMKADGYYIYRRPEGKGIYRKIKTVKASALKNGSWYDTSVQAGTRYQYKIKAFKKSGRKKYSGPFSEALSMSAVRQNARFRVSGNPAGASPVLVLKSDQYNGVLVVNEYGLIGNGYGLSDDDDICFIAKEYSKDGTTWLKKGDISIPAGGTLLIRFEKTRREDLNPYLDDEIGAGIMSIRSQYNHIPVFLELRPFEGTGKTSPDMEAIH